MVMDGAATAGGAFDETAVALRRFNGLKNPRQQGMPRMMRRAVLTMRMRCPKAEPSWVA